MLCKKCCVSEKDSGECGTAFVVCWFNMTGKIQRCPYELTAVLMKSCRFEQTGFWISLVMITSEIVARNCFCLFLV